MGCGSPLGDLFYLADSLLDRPYSRLVSPSPVRAVCERERGAGGEGLRAQLYQMYGEGQIIEEVFTALRTLAGKGQLRPADLAVHQARPASGIFDVSHRPAGHRDPSTLPSAAGQALALTNALRGIRSRLAQLARARAASEKVLTDLEARLTGLDERAVGKERAAREIIGRDEEEARQRLTEKAEFARSRDQLAAQAEALRADLARLDDLRAQLEAKAAELEAVQARDRLNEEVLK